MGKNDLQTEEKTRVRNKSITEKRKDEIIRDLLECCEEYYSDDEEFFQSMLYTVGMTEEELIEFGYNNLENEQEIEMTMGEV